MSSTACGTIKLTETLFSGFADSMFSTLDLVTLWNTARITGELMIKNLLNGKI